MFLNIFRLHGVLSSFSSCSFVTSNKRFNSKLLPLQLLNCIMDMVEKTRRSLTVLRRCQEADREEMNHWIRRYSDVEEMKKGGSNGQHCLPPPPPPTTHHSSSSNTASSSESLPVGTPSSAERQTGRQTGRRTHTGYFG